MIKASFLDPKMFGVEYHKSPNKLVKEPIIDTKDSDTLIEKDFSSISFQVRHFLKKCYTVFNGPHRSVLNPQKLGTFRDRWISVSNIYVLCSKSSNEGSAT